MEENLIKMRISPENINTKIDTHSNNFLSMELTNESIDKSTNFPPLGGLPPEVGNIKTPQDNAWSSLLPPDLTKKPVSKVPSQIKEKTCHLVLNLLQEEVQMDNMATYQIVDAIIASSNFNC